MSSIDTFKERSTTPVDSAKAPPHHHKMVYRMPTPCSPRVQSVHEQQFSATPWRGSIVIAGIQQNSGGVSQSILAACQEIIGDENSSHMDLWPEQLRGRVVHEHTVPPDVQGWIDLNVPALFSVVIDRQRDANAHTENRAAFTTLWTTLSQRQTFAVIPGPFGPAQGLLLYPSSSSNQVILGVVLEDNLPPFVSESMLRGGTPPMIALQPAPYAQVRSQGSSSQAQGATFPYALP